MLIVEFFTIPSLLQQLNVTMSTMHVCMCMSYVIISKSGLQFHATWTPLIRKASLVNTLHPHSIARIAVRSVEVKRFVVRKPSTGEITVKSDCGVEILAEVQICCTSFL